MYPGMEHISAVSSWQSDLFFRFLPCLCVQSPPTSKPAVGLSGRELFSFGGAALQAVLGGDVAAASTSVSAWVWQTQREKEGGS